MKSYTVRIPLCGVYTNFVDAESEAEAIEKARNNDEGEVEWELMDTIVEGNVFNGPCNTIEVECDDDEESSSATGGSDGG